MNVDKKCAIMLLDEICRSRVIYYDYYPQGLDMDRMLGLQDSYIHKQFEMTGLELDRATNSSYMDMTR